MKIAVTTEGTNIFQHFGQCKQFTMYETENSEIKGKTLLDAGENGHSALATLLGANQVDLLICGGIGQGAKDALKSAGVQLVAGASGDIETAVKAYLAGTLAHNADFTCNHHGHEHGEGHTCGGHCGH